MMRTRRVQERLEGVNLSGTIVKHSAVFKIYFLNVRTSSDCGPADMNGTLVLWLQNRMTLKNKTQQISKMESKTEFLTCKINWVQGHLTEASGVKRICHFLHIYISLFFLPRFDNFNRQQNLSTPSPKLLTPHHFPRQDDLWLVIISEISEQAVSWVKRTERMITRLTIFKNHSNLWNSVMRLFECLYCQ